MSAPDKCPKCGAGFRFKELESYVCDSQFEEDDDGRFLAQSYHCLATQRDQLAERLKRLEAEGRELARRHLLVVVTYPQAQADVSEYEKATR